MNAKSIMAVMMLAASKGTTLEIIARGEDAGAALDELEQLIKDRFGEPE
ncbi:MAG: HPr family phosphocarrier protein [Gammaproteobacteria bacterium]|nr:HPr family phosphocarrier protein [Gammaproteobacteria bacterium]